MSPKSPRDYPTGRQGDIVVHSVAGEPGAEWLFWFWCPGCNDAHAFRVPRWTFDGNFAAPTFAPSLRCNRGEGRTCHLFLQGGRLVFLSDCAHALAGQTVDLPAPPEWLT